MRTRDVVRSAVGALALVATSVGSAAGEAPRPAPGHLLYDEALAAVGAPGFAGVWLEDRRLVVATTRPGAAVARAARADVARLLGRPDLATKPVVARPARYTFRQLQQWRAAVRASVLALPGTVSLDVDERANVLRVGAEARTAWPRRRGC